MSIEQNKQSSALELWLKELDATTEYTNNKYAASFEDISCSEETHTAYINFCTINYQVREVVQHLISYGSVYAPHKCVRCNKNDPAHCNTIQNTYKQYRKLINYKSTGDYARQKTIGQAQS